MESQIRAILHKAGVRTPLDDEELNAIASSASSASGLSASSGVKSPGEQLSASIIDGGGSSADLSLASDVLRTLRTPQRNRSAEHRNARVETPSHPTNHGIGASAVVGMSDALRRE